MKIIAGSLKGKKINTEKDYSYRPITSMLKEAIFSIIASEKFISHERFYQATSVDLFCGTGSLSFEALSRGLKKAILIDKDPKHINMLYHNAEKLDINDKVEIIRGNALSLPRAKTACTIAFIDPPFNHGLVEECVKSLVNQGWLEHDALIFIRTHQREKYNIPNYFIEIFSRKYGNSMLCIYKFSDKDNNGKLSECENKA